MKRGANREKVVLSLFLCIREAKLAQAIVSFRSYRNSTTFEPQNPSLLKIGLPILSSSPVGGKRKNGLILSHRFRLHAYDRTVPAIACVEHVLHCDKFFRTQFGVMHVYVRL